MRTFITLTIAIALLIAVAPVMADQAADEAAIKKAHEQRIAAYNAKDVKAYLTFFDEDCTNAYNGNSCGANIRESGEFPEARKTNQVKKLEERSIVFITPDTAIHRYVAGITGRLDADGKPLPPGKAERANVFVRKGGKWLLAVTFRRLMEE